MGKENLKQPLLVDDSAAAAHSAAAAGGGHGDVGAIEMTEEAALRLLSIHGYNELQEVKVHPLIKFLGYFKGPIPFLMEAATLISLVLFAYEASHHEKDADPATWVVLFVLLLINGCMGFKEESSAGNAIDALKKSLAPTCRVKRDGRFVEKQAKLLVPGDTIILKGGDIVPADSKLGEGEPMEVDQSALTGESLPVTVFAGDVVYSGSVVKRGELHATVVATGSQTFFGKAAALVSSVNQVGHLQKILLKIAYFLMAMGVTLVGILFAILLAVQERPWPSALVSCLVLLVASIPIAMQVVTTATMAVGARNLAQEKAIVARLAAIEELAGMTILCSDKTGTLTKNKLTLDTPNCFVGTEDEIIFASALAAKWEGQDAIDGCLTASVADQSFLKQHKQVKFIPFDPVSKRTEATIVSPDGKTFRVSKGAPQVIAAMAHNKTAIADEVDEVIEAFGMRGFRALGVARTDEHDVWHFLGLIPLFDPPRDDTKVTIERALEMGVEVKMITGDHMTIAKETCRRLGMGTNIYTIDALNSLKSEEQQGEMAENADGFAQVFPEHKFEIVEVLQKRGHLTGMTGDGVNDAPALKKADVGIAVEGATDAARAAADIVLTEPGLSVIIIAMTKAREIFARMKAYVIYRIAATLTLLLFMFVGQIALVDKPNPPVDSWAGFPFAPDADHAAAFTPLNSSTPSIATVPLAYNYGSSQYPHFTLPAIVLVILTILNDGTIMSIAYDRVVASKDPQKWNLLSVMICCILLGLLGFAEIMIAYVSLSNSSLTAIERTFSAASGYIQEGTNRLPLTPGQIESVMYLILSIGGQAIVFAARTEGFFFSRAPSKGLLVAFTFAQLTSILFALFWPFQGSLEPLAMNSYTNCLGVGPDNFLRNGALTTPRTYNVLTYTYVEGSAKPTFADISAHPVARQFTYSSSYCNYCTPSSPTDPNCALHAVRNGWVVGFVLFWAMMFFLAMDITKVVYYKWSRSFFMNADEDHLKRRKLQKRLSVAVDSERRATATRASVGGGGARRQRRGTVAAEVAKTHKAELAGGSVDLERVVKNMNVQMSALEEEHTALRELISRVLGRPVPEAEGGGH